ncbi:tyrosine-type recombinase/integrase [Haloferax sp. MBLA0076]|uniref:Tyrosine-type recombinase/integrase n=1 Tax=Haloferax litoreum TaxID=2666140 RepID=A0A6A8GGG0_9EURY|nr:MULTISPECIES: tyrosine-type recombinase/integrase [Haloferax]KAB1192423.1 phage integrase family protein [Haloferax sp. CBA1148]MRX20890.1 tyrosine-type recombinase/integrase [Haloferax litoreum]
MIRKTSHQIPSDSPVCPLYKDAKERARWKELQNEYNLMDARCGHVINYLCENIDGNIRPGSAQAYSCRLNRFSDYIYNDELTVCTAEMQHVHSFFNMLCDEGKRKNTLLGYRTSLKNIYRFIDVHFDDELNLEWYNIDEFIKPSQYPTLPPIERRSISAEEVKLLMDNLCSLRDRLIARIVLEHGLRCSDLQKLKVSNINLDENRIVFYNTKSRIWQRAKINDELALELRHWLEVGRNSSLVDPENEYLLPGTGKKHLSKTCLNEAIVEAAENAGIQEIIGKVKLTGAQRPTFSHNREYRVFHRVTLHTLRHTFNQLMIDAGVPREARSAAMGHSSTETTKKYYEHNEEDYEELVAELFPGLQLGV